MITALPPSLSGSDLPPLPEGWIELVVPDTSRKYYLNIESRVTTWERPVPEAASLPAASQLHTMETSKNSLKSEKS